MNAQPTSGPARDDDLPDALARDLRAAFVVAPAEDVVARHLAAMLAAVPAAPVAVVAPRRSRRWLAVAGIGTAFALGGGLATAGALPAPVQRAVAGVVAPLGIDLPDPAGDAPAPTTSTTTSTDDDGPATTGEPRGNADGAGQSEDAPGQGGDAPGQSEDAPGQGGVAPGNSENAPGQGGENPSVTAPGQSGDSPSVTAPGQSGDNPSVTAPGQQKPPTTPTTKAPGGNGNGGGPVTTDAKGK